MRFVMTVLALTIGCAAFAADGKIDFSFKNKDIGEAIGEYARASGQKFIIDPSVQGKVTILNPGSVSTEEAFNQLSSALALIGCGISRQDGVMVVMPARAIQRNYIEVGSDLPALKPERMYTWVIHLKNASADEVNKQMRILTSKDGELVPYTRSNQIYVTDWTSNLHRIAKIMQEVDAPVSKSNGKAHVKEAKAPVKDAKVQ